MKELIEIQKNRNDSLTLYDDGTLEVSAYSYEISSYGAFELSKDETRRLYEAMKLIFEA